MAKALMVQGTGSGAGKSLITAALCRIFRDTGLRVAPFKGQNMALNSYITLEGGEIGRAQALQAEASGIEPTVDMNPVLLKVSEETGSQVIIQGKVLCTMKAREYYASRERAWNAVRESYDRLSQKYELIIMEGAGSPAEINLMKSDIVNMSAAKYAKAPVILIGDIDKGGVFASLYGTMKLLGRDSRHIKGFLINKFRGDLGILRPGLDMIRQKTGKPVIGVLPYVTDISLPEEDGLALQKYQSAIRREHSKGTIRIVVVGLRYISNFTDFDPLACEPDVEVIFSRNHSDIENADLVIVPGTKNTVKDLLMLREMELDESIKRANAKGVQVMGMCGGFQMLGRRIMDPHGVESSRKEIEGIGLLDIETVFHQTKTTCRVEAELGDSSLLVNHSMRDKFSGYQKSAINHEPLKGYEIHMGTSSGNIGLFRVRRLLRAGGRVQHETPIPDGSRNGNCWGTYLHGIFENDAFGILDHIRTQKGLDPLKSNVNYAEVKEAAIDRLACVVRDNIDMDFVRRTAGL